MGCPVHQQGGSAQRRFPLSPSCKCTEEEGRDYLVVMGKRRARDLPTSGSCRASHESVLLWGRGQPLRGGVRLGGGVGVGGGWGWGRYLKTGSRAPQ